MNEIAKADGIALPAQPGPAPEGWRKNLQPLTSLQIASVMQGRLPASLGGRKAEAEAVSAIVVSITPQDAIEELLAVQILAAHHAAVECFARAMIAGQPIESRAYNLSAGNKCSRTFATLLETLNKHRGKGQQKVTVEHVHVYQGGQAIVGPVEQFRGRGRGCRKTSKQPHGG